MRGLAPNVFTIPANIDFSAALSDAILTGHLPGGGISTLDQLSLADWTVLVPTRRAVRTIVAAFASQCAQNASLLPQIRPLGDADEDEILSRAVLAGQAEFGVPPAISNLKRQFVLSGMILDWLAERGNSELAGNVLGSANQALLLAESLGVLIDRFDTDEIPLAAIQDLLESELAFHRQDFLEFLVLLRQSYPAYLETHGLIGQMERRSRLIRAQAEINREAETTAPIIAAGSTGSIPATAELLKTIAWLPAGAVVLPGLDQTMDEDSWQALEAHHPQFGFRELLSHIGIDRSEVQELASPVPEPSGKSRSWFISEVMRPGATSERWRDTIDTGSHRLEAACNGLQWLEAPEQQSEALVIALIMRRALDTPGGTAALITPDRQLARRVKSELGRWSIEVDDTAGEPVSRTPQGAFVSLLADAALDGFSPSKLIALLDHPFSLFGLARADLVRAAGNLEMAVFRGRLSAPGLGGLVGDVELSRSTTGSYSHRVVKNLRDDDWQQISDLAERLVSSLEELGRILTSETPLSLKEFIQVHLRTAENISANANTGTPQWQEQAGAVLAELFAMLAENADDCPPLMPIDYAALVRRLLAAAPVRPAHVRHPRLAIYGLLEARLVRHDVTIMGGLNEGTWPNEADIDPWLNRPQKAALALQLPERRLGLMAHDFAQAATAADVWMTSSRKIDGQPVVASRWLLRMKALLKAADKERFIKSDDPWVGWALGLDQPDKSVRIKPPRPCPPVSARPTRLSVTRIDRLIKDPYGIFANQILGLEPLEDIEAELGGRERGTLVHKALERFVRHHPGPLAAGAAEQLMAEFHGLFDEMVSDPALYAFWQPQMQRMAEWFVSQEREWRPETREQYVEQKAVFGFDVANHPFTLSCVADRIDVKHDGTLRLIDYKTGQLPGAKPSSANYSVQLDIEAYMAMQGAFESTGAAEVSETVFMRLSGGDPAGALRTTAKGIDTVSKAAFKGLLSLLEDYARPSQAYLAIGGPSREARPFEFDHLSRWREWNHLDDDGAAS